MENAHPKLKEKANYITKSNKEEGVLVTIEKFIK
ncbi:HAD family hydrolase [Fusobacterium necrophorum]|nr:HAD hydrolase family protein [Fusobacterium necrophorum]